MQSVSINLPSQSFTSFNSAVPILHIYKPALVTGLRKKIIQKLIWLNILVIAIKKGGSIAGGIRKVRQLKNLRLRYANNVNLTKYQLVGNRYYYSYNAPGWPSQSFNRYITHMLGKQSQTARPSLHTLIFAITKKCGFKCEHCSEWENLNKPERLGQNDLLQIINRFHVLGISQLQLSGGEPLNRLDDILYLLDHLPTDIDCWMYTTGFQLNFEKACLLKKHGLRGLGISIDDHDASRHDRFRGRAGSFHRALKACNYATMAGLVVTFSICPTKDFISEDNLLAYAKLAKKHGASFIQIMEPKAVGHYANMDVTLKPDHIKILETFYEKMNSHEDYASFPTVVYHGYYSRRMGCAGSGHDYLYVDTDGDVHSCPFCQKKLFHVFDDNLAENISAMRKAGCGVFEKSSISINSIDQPLIKTV